ncbi:glycoside hydrolase domain-containing protein [Acuticoccus kandeliae]|uniref:glycoside hydrolase domain-containing protein n=1 Tax=Acuticoccus kandeliae TaxID=2073160 RepID=UPI000D3EB4BD|nr:glycoside hydrolase domain-containing protein [Acuticoccus kandeliae]
MRIFLALLTALTLATGPARAAETRVAIIDAAWDTRPYIDDLKGAGILIIGRYLARCPQPERHIPEKRLIDQGTIKDGNSEVVQILRAGMGILSIYQYNNDSKFKFHGKDRNGKPLPDGNCRPTSRERSPAAEAELDANAAVEQARALGQPRGSAIYFGVDIAFNRNDSSTRGAMVEYFRTVKRIVERGGYNLGAYGNGDALDVLLAEKLIQHTWLSASRAYPGSSAFHNTGRWQLFQSGVNLEWFTGSPGQCRRGLPLDTNVQNARYATADLGFWTNQTPVRLHPDRVRAVHAARRFSCDGDARIRRTARSAPDDLISKGSRCQGGRTVRQADTVDYANAARIGRRAGDMVEVDYDDDGTFDGWTAASNLTPSFDRKPEWIHSSASRRGARCP